jgi:hypothetical protein
MIGARSSSISTPARFQTTHDRSTDHQIPALRYDTER